MISLDLNRRKKKKWTSLIERRRRRRSRVEQRCMTWIVIRSILILCTFLYVCTFFFLAELYVCTYLSFKALLWHFWHDFVCTRFCRNNRTIYTICTFLQHLVWFVIIIRVRNCLIIFLLLFFIIYLFIYFLVFKSRYLSPFWQTDYLL